MKNAKKNILEKELHDNFLTIKSDIVSWLDKYDIKNCTLISDAKYDFVVNVDGDVNLTSKKLTNIPVKFNNATGSFSCNDNKLASLEFCPETVAGSFYCGRNNLTSLEYCPKTVHGDFYCNNNKLMGVDMNRGHSLTELYKINCEHKIIAEKAKLESNILNKDKKSYNNISVNNRKIKV